ncbi:concanavalin A-like lectin/glucanase superfamily [Synechococcus phage S-CRES3]|nr:concanavalin A-like lectin/glucanase superfamily [Synechococcus phage S-CRES3]
MGYFGSSALSDIKFGSSAVSKVYRGASLLWELVAPGDPDFANVSLLLHGNGTDGGTVFTDSSSGGYAISSYDGGTTTSTTQIKYGSASLLFTGTSNIQVTGTANSQTVAGFGANDFTVEFWAYPTASTSNAGCVAYGNSSSSSPSFFIGLGTIGGSENMYFYYSLDGTNSTLVSGTVAKTLLNAWSHCAVTRQGGTLRGFVDGTEVFNTTISGSIAAQPTSTVKFGRGNSANFTGHLDDIRVTKGVARYTGAFTPPAAEFPDS